MSIRPLVLGVREPCSRLRWAKRGFAHKPRTVMLHAEKAQAWLTHSKNSLSWYRQLKTTLSGNGREGWAVFPTLNMSVGVYSVCNTDLSFARYTQEFEPTPRLAFKFENRAFSTW